MSGPPLTLASTANTWRRKVLVRRIRLLVAATITYNMIEAGIAWLYSVHGSDEIKFVAT